MLFSPLAGTHTGGGDDREGLEGWRFLHHVRRGGVPRGSWNGGFRPLLFCDAGGVPGATVDETDVEQSEQSRVRVDSSRGILR